MARQPITLGPPNEKQIVGSAEVQVRDDLGLPLDPMMYADPCCRECYGRGVTTRVRHLNQADTLQLMRKQAEARGENPELITDEQVAIGGDNTLKTMISCGCAAKGYRRERERVLAQRGAFSVSLPVSLLRKP